MKTIRKYGLVIVKDGRFLINRKKGTSLFLMPGGKPESGESVIDCLAREIREEHGVELVRDSARFLGEFEDVAANEQDTRISMKVYVGEIIGDPVPCSEIEEQRWFGRGDDGDILSSIIKNKILPALIRAEKI